MSQQNQQITTILRSLGQQVGGLAIDVAERDGIIAGQNAELERMGKELHEANARREALQTQLQALQAKIAKPSRKPTNRKAN